MKRLLFKTCICLALTTVFISCSTEYDSVDNGFDKICLIYVDVFNDPKLNGNSKTDKHKVIHTRIKSYVIDVDAITAFTAVALANPDDKYKLFKQSAEYSLKRTWDCEFIKNL